MRIAVTTVFALILLVAAPIGCTRAPEEAAVAAADDTPPYYRIGDISRPANTDSDEAQLWFDRGLGMAYGFNHEEALACFEKAAAADPECAMCYWGQAYVLGPNYNNVEVTPEANDTAHAAITRAAELAANQPDLPDADRALIEAMQTRFAMPAPEDRTALEQAYADAMRTVHVAHGDDPDVVALAAEAVMMLRPWQLWSHDGVPAPETPEIRGILEPALERWPNHPALAHLYIHTMEAGPLFDLATEAAENLEALDHGLGHLTHMPSHIYVWSGRFDDVIRTNQEAVVQDEAYVEHGGRMNFYTLYRLHNYHFVAYGSMWDGRRETALAASRKLVGEIPDELLTEWADFLDIFTATPYHVLVRFGMWDEILAEPEPQGDARAAARAVWRYARGIAHASKGDVAGAEAELKAFLAARKATPESRMLFNNKVADILSVAEHVLRGEVQYRKGNHDRAFALLREAVALDEKLNYDEPWGWMEPARHPLGALLTEQGRFEEALLVYEENLERYPENGWALHGMSEALRGLGRDDEADDAWRRFEAAWSDSDVVIPGSCFCKAAA